MVSTKNIRPANIWVTQRPTRLTRVIRCSYVEHRRWLRSHTVQRLGEMKRKWALNRFIYSSHARTHTRAPARSGQLTDTLGLRDSHWDMFKPASISEAVHCCWAFFSPTKSYQFFVLALIPPYAMPSLFARIFESSRVSFFYPRDLSKCISIILGRLNSSTGRIESIRSTIHTHKHNALINGYLNFV